VADPNCDDSDPPLTFVACVSDEQVLDANLLASACLKPGSGLSTTTQSMKTAAVNGNSGKLLTTIANGSRSIPILCRMRRRPLASPDNPMT
jgi:hypothetical protein